MCIQRKSRLLCLAAAVAVVVALHLSPFILTRLWASGPNFIAKQGQIRVAGQPANGQKTMTFRLNTDATGTGTVVWSKTASVYCINGMFNYPLSTDDSLVKISDLDFANQQYYMSMQLEGGNEMMPREPLAAIPYAFCASTATNLRGNGHIRITGAGPHYIYTDNFGIGTQTPDQKLTVAGNISQTGTIISSGTGNNYFAGKMGIGITNPSYPLHIDAGSTAENTDFVSIGRTSRAINFGTRAGASYSPSIQAVRLSDNAVYPILLNPDGGNVGIGSTAPTALLTVSTGTISTTTLFQVGNATMTVLKNGNVGIGTTSPAGPLDINGKVIIGKYYSPGPAGDVIAGVSNLHLQNADSGSSTGKLYLNYFVNSDVVIAYGGGNVGIGTTNPVFKLTVDANGPFLRARRADAVRYRSDFSVASTGLNINAFDDQAVVYLPIRIDASTTVLGACGNVGIGVVNPSYLLDVRGSIGGNGGLYHASDVRWKKNIVSVDAALDKISKLRGVYFEWKRDEFNEMNFPKGRHLGVIAQEVESVLPEVVSTNNEGYKSVEYSNISAVLIEAIKQLKTENDELKAEIAEIRNRLDKTGK